MSATRPNDFERITLRDAELDPGAYVVLPLNAAVDPHQGVQVVRNSGEEAIVCQMTVVLPLRMFSAVSRILRPGGGMALNPLNGMLSPGVRLCIPRASLSEQGHQVLNQLRASEAAGAVAGMAPGSWRTLVSAAGSTVSHSEAPRRGGEQLAWHRGPDAGAIAATVHYYALIVSDDFESPVGEYIASVTLYTPAGEVLSAFVLVGSEELPQFCARVRELVRTRLVAWIADQGAPSGGAK